MVPGLFSCREGITYFNDEFKLHHELQSFLLKKLPDNIFFFEGLQHWKF